MARVAIFGGSFDPPHVAHQMVCLWALSTDRADEVWLIPCFSHAFDKQLTPFEHRLRMCHLATELLPGERVRVSDVEAQIGGTSRTFNTVSQLRERHPEHEFSLLIGADLLTETSAWYRFDELRELVELIVVGRPGYSDTKTLELARVSSSEVRRRLVAGQDASALLPSAVLAYIERQQLYRLVREQG
ncbi:MAG: nicotinate (nicotinamide) nucleotide adenylyltransferase [Proteobacteria bacterium]|nr:MAG: nicotinate (nicotinamide) nucleotide adenylyltransferase [Pseudomonadota bacterium]PIE19834.1 MAG: nicotinate (nicotinamide) nucleotide adenylyltransferase [Pseudomonadota bacterium]